MHPINGLQRRALLYILVIFFLTGCNATVGQGQSQVTNTNNYHLSPTSQVGQTFTSRNAGLSGLEIYLEPDSSGASGEVLLHLKDNPQAPDILQTTIGAESIDHAGFYRFSFNPQANSYLKDYYLLLELRGKGSFRLGSASGDTYLDGAIYLNGIPQDEQLTFQQTYSSIGLSLGLVAQGLTWLWQLFLACLVFVLPGWGILSAFWVGWKRLDWMERLGLAAGVSLAFIPIFFLISDFIGLHLGPLYVWIPLSVSILFLAWKNRSILRTGISLQIFKKMDWVAISLLITSTAVIGIRLWVIRSIEYPMWGDSYQHTMITQLMIDQNGLFKSWSQYVPYISLTVQYGFPAAAAVFAWISGFTSSQASIWVGQVQNALAILVLYPLALRLSKGQRWVGICTIMIGGLFISMPMMYVNWGRYAQLGGQVILPVAIWLGWDVFETRQLDLKKGLVLGLTLAGMLLTYYRMFFYFATFFIAWFLCWAIPEWRFKLKNWKAFLISALIIIAFTIVLVIPWLSRVTGSSLATGIENGLTTTSPIEGIKLDYANWKDIGSYVPPTILIAACIAVLWSLYQRKWMVGGIALWTGFIASVKAGELIHLPGANMMQSFAVLIFLYVPASLLAGWILGQVIDVFDKKLGKIGGIVLVFLAIGFSAWGIYDLRNIASPAIYGYVTRPDIRAAEWIKTNTNLDATFLVEGYRIYNGQSAVGSDAGWWLPLLADRHNSMPPQYALLNEVPQPPDYTKKVVDLVTVLETNPPSTPTAISALCQMGITHIYIGQKQGQVGYGVSQLYNRNQIVGSSQFAEIYHQDRVSVFALKPGVCHQTTYEKISQP
jgi:hypothetical protein